MKLVICPQGVGGVAELKVRMMRRFAYLAWIAADMGHEVVVGGSKEWRAPLRGLKPYGGRSDFAFLNIFDAFDTGTAGEGDVTFLPEPSAVGLKKALPGKVVCWRTALGGAHKIVDKRHLLDLVVGYILTQRDFTRKTHSGGKPRGDTPVDTPLGDKWFSVPWIPFEPTLSQIHRDGMWQHYCRDDLGAIRERYGADDKHCDVGFAGNCGYGRSTIARQYDGDPRFDIRWAAHVGEALPPDEYLRWLSGCRAVLHLPGDTWKCSRHCEAVMMGVPVVQLRGVIHLAPPLSESNTILVDDWGDKDAIFAGVGRANDIAASADLAYRAGWSLRGQFKQVMKRLGCS